MGKAKDIVTNLDAGRTVKAPISKLGVSWTPVISKENVTCTDLPVGPVAGVSGVAANGDLSTGAIGICAVSGMVRSVFVCRNTGPAKTVFGNLDAGSEIASAADDSISVKVVS